MIVARCIILQEFNGIRMERTIKERILSVFKYKKINVNRASKILGIPQRTLNRQVNEDGKVGMELVYSLLNNFPEVSPNWLLMGQGDMLQGEDGTPSLHEAAPFYNNLPVTAGLREVFDPANEKPTGYISVPNWSAQFYFPVSGTSMEPEIHSGDIVGVNSIDSLVAIDSEKTYMIVTREGRMIKHCAACVDDDELLLCSSPNYPDFTSRKEEILRMYEVVVKISSV